MSLKSEVYRLLRRAELLCEDCPDAEELSRTLVEMRQRLNQPLRIAVTGVMKTGKSTFMNALMGSRILCTGALETTYTVCWFRYGEQKRLKIYFREGQSIDAPFSDLEKWSAHKSRQENARLDDVQYIVIYYPSPTLRTMEFIDTPGLDSVHGTDAQNTLDFLALQGSNDTLYHSGLADAIIYTFNNTAKAFDQSILEAFRGNGEKTVSPINSIGILSKVDASGIWQVTDDATPVEVAEKVSETVMQNANIRRFLYMMQPICAKACEGYAMLNDQDWDLLYRLSEEDFEELQLEYLYDAASFVNESGEKWDALGSSEVRGHLMELLGQYGILEIVRQIQMGKTPEEIGPILRKTCGIDAVEHILLRHFGNRSFLIKTQYIFNSLRSVVHRIRKSKNSGERILSVCEHLMDDMNAMEMSDQTLKELKVLQMYYNAQVRFTSEEEELDCLRITGEYGRSVEARLGVSGPRKVSELADFAREKALLWNSRAGGFLLSRDYIEAASIIARSYESIYFHLHALEEE